MRTNKCGLAGVVVEGNSHHRIAYRFKYRCSNYERESFHDVEMLSRFFEGEQSISVLWQTRCVSAAACLDGFVSLRHRKLTCRRRYAAAYSYCPVRP